MIFCRVFLGIGCLCLAGCGAPNSGAVPPSTTPAAPQSPVSIGYLPETDLSPVHGLVEGTPFMPRSVVFARADNADGHHELQVALTDVANYCDILSGGAQADGVVARLRVVNMGPAGNRLPVDAATYVEDAGPTWVGAVRDIPPPGAQAGATASAPLEEGRHMTGGYVRLRLACSIQQLNPAFVGSDVVLTAVDDTSVRGSVMLRFSDAVGTTAGFALSGEFSAVPCPALAAAVAATPFAPFAPAVQCAPDTE